MILVIFGDATSTPLKAGAANINKINKIPITKLAVPAIDPKTFIDLIPFAAKSTNNKNIISTNTCSTIGFKDFTILGFLKIAHEPATIKFCGFCAKYGICTTQ